MTQSKSILVTGAAGYIASWIVAQLLDKGYIVHATVRRIDDRPKTRHLLDLAIRHQGRLVLFEADLLVKGSFDKAMVGCSTVIHTASPYFLDKPDDPQKQLIEPARDGTLNVLDSVNRTASVKRVVLTSGIVALYNDACDLSASSRYTVQEQDFNSNTNVHHNTYAYSKTLAELAAWEHQSKQQRWDLVTIHPGVTFGPSLSKRIDATSINMMIEFLNGSFRMGVPRLWLGVVDVRDVAAAHIRAALLPQAKHRYIVVADSLRLLEIARLLRPDDYGLENRLPYFEVPKPLIWLLAPFVGMQRSFVARNVNFPLYFNNHRSRQELGLTYMPVETTLNDHCCQIISDGLLQS